MADVTLFHITLDVEARDVLCLADALQNLAGKVLRKASKAFSWAYHSTYVALRNVCASHAVRACQAKPTAHFQEQFSFGH